MPCVLGPCLLVISRKPLRSPMLRVRPSPHRAKLFTVRGYHGKQLPSVVSSGGPEFEILKNPRHHDKEPVRPWSALPYLSLDNRCGSRRTARRRRNSVFGLAWNMESLDDPMVQTRGRRVASKQPPASVGEELSSELLFGTSSWQYCFQLRKGTSDRCKQRPMQRVLKWCTVLKSSVPKRGLLVQLGGCWVLFWRKLVQCLVGPSAKAAADHWT